MDPLLEIVAVLAPVAILCAITIYLVMLGWRRADERPVLLGEVLARQGPHVFRLAVASGTPDFARAIRNCLNCGAVSHCRTWLDSGAHDGYQEFCPNAGYVERVKRLA